MHARWQLLASYALVGGCGAAVALMESTPAGSALGAAVKAGAAVLAAALVSTHLAWGRIQRLRDTVRELATASLDEPVWAQRVELPGLPALEQTLDDLRERTHQRFAQLSMEGSRLRVILESITVGVLVTGRDGRVIMANQALARLFGLRGQTTGRLPVELVRHNHVAEAIGESLESGTERGLEISLRTVGEVNLDVHVGPIRRDGECVGVVTVFYDITRMRQLERVRKDFVANVSHELRTPLTAIKGYAETLADGALDDRNAAERFIHVISSHADRLNRLLDDILDLSRLEAENLDLHVDICPLRPLAEGCFSSVSQVAARKNITVALEIPPETRVACDGKLIEQALLNLLDNAVKYTPEGGTVGIGLEPLESNEGVDKRVAVRVSDTGIGIPSRDLERIFERFYRVDKGRSRAMGGTGLGLSIVRHIVQAHGERVWVESELGKGSSFRFSLRAA